MPTIDANGRATAYEVDGAGPPLVLLHGATGSGGDHFAPLRSLLARAFRCYMPDARGHGGTAWDPTEDWTTAEEWTARGADATHSSKRARLRRLNPLRGQDKPTE